jgi:hypothetical protein
MKYEKNSRYIWTDYKTYTQNAKETTTAAAATNALLNLSQFPT